MHMTMTEKILARGAGLASVTVGDVVITEIETIVAMDGSFQPERMNDDRWHDVAKVERPDRVVIIFDHNVPASDVRSAAAHRFGREFARQFGIERLHDVGTDQGIAHSVVAERGYAIPGTVLVNSDSHTCAAGAFNCAARGAGRPDMVLAVATGKAWYRISPTVRYDLHGSLPAGVSAKDVFLTIAGKWGAHPGMNVEYGGSGMSSLSIAARRTLAAMGAELSADFVIFEPDEQLLDYLGERNPKGNPIPTWPDEHAGYLYRRAIDLSVIEPLVALPDAVVDNSVPISQVEGIAIDQAFIGSCANGSLEDIEVAARILKGRKVARGTRLLVTPGTQGVYLAALRAGYVEILMAAGAVVTPATCGACFGGHMGVLGPDEVCITASTRNFKGRMGDPSARIYMASPATVAASAIAGCITSAAACTGGEP